jgi:hypothetical protein
MAGYSARQSTYVDGDVIDAADSNDEFNQLLASFVNTTGHKHDGTAGEGPVIGLIGDPGETTPLNKVVIDNPNNQIEFSVDVSSSSVEQLVIKDGVVEPTTNNDIDLGASSKQFKDLYIDGVANVDSIAMPTTTVTDILDEDNMSSNSATALATQQSIKAYVDTQLTAEDLDFQADSGGALSIDLDSETLTFTGGTGIDTSGSGNAVTFAIDSTVTTLAGSQTLTNKTLTAPVIATISNSGTITLPTSTDTLVGRATTDTLTNKTLTSAVLNGSISGTSIKDEDDMSSDSASHLATQQSIKAYVDSQVTAQDLDFQADSGGALSIDLDSETMTFTGGTGIDTSGSGNAVTFAIDSTVTTLAGSQTLTNKTLTTPVISSISNSGTITLPTDTDTLVGRATSDTLTNKTIDADNNTVSNIEVDNLKSGVLDTDLSSVAGTDTTLASAKAIKTYVDAQVTASDLDFQADSGGALSIDLDSETMTFTGGTGIDTSGSSNTVTFAIDSTVTTLAGTQTLTNKTLTSPTINGGSLSSTVTGTTQSAGTSNTTIATTAFAVTEANNAAVAMAIALG